MKRAFALLEAIIVIVVVLVVTAIGFTVFSQRPTPTRSACQSNLKLVTMGMMQYVQDHDGTFPPARVTSTTGWADSARPYIKAKKAFQCPATRKSRPLLTDFFYNRRLAHEAGNKIKSPAQTIVLGECSDDAPTWTSVSQLPSSWLTKEDSPARRHRGGANYAFADGHIKWLAPLSIKPTLDSAGVEATFAIR